MKKFFLFIWEIVKISVIALVIVVPIRVFVFQPFFVRGASMEPNFHDFDYLIIDEISYRFSQPARGNVIVFNNPSDTSQKFIKRIIGLPFETVKIENGQVMIKKEAEFRLLDESAYLPKDRLTPGNIEVSLEQDEYFVLGDNRGLSLDSRSFGPLKKNYIIGKEALKLWPISAFAGN